MDEGCVLVVLELSNEVMSDDSRRTSSNELTD